MHINQSLRRILLANRIDLQYHGSCKGVRFMELRIKQRVFSWGDTYDIYDETGEARYWVQSELFAFGHQIHVFDKRSGREVGSIHQKLFTFMPQFEIVMNGHVAGTVSKRMTLFTPHYQVDFKNWDVEGDFLGWDYSVKQGVREVMSISKELFTWGDSYVLRYREFLDEIPGLLLVLAIDAANCDHN
jgi:uncharacterized protein YxjI